MDRSDTGILIAGGGVPGLALAILLGRLGIPVTVADARPAAPLARTAPGGRTSALMRGSVNILKAAGGWNSAALFGEKLQTLRIIDDSRPGAPPVRVEFAASEIGMDHFGINMPNNIMRAALAEEAARMKTVTMIESALTGLEPGEGRIAARFENGITVTAALLVGADGRESTVRRLAGIECRTRDYGQRAITCLIDHTIPHANVSTEFHRPSGPFTLVPLPGNRSSVVWVDKEDRAKEFAALSPHAFERALTDRSGGLLGKIALASKPESVPLAAMRAKTLTGPRLALIAEAAHILHPLGAQGLNLSLRDAAALAETLADALRTGLDPGCAAILDRYERRRRPDIMERAAGTDSLNRMVSNKSGLIGNLRRFGLKTLDRTPPLRRLAMHHGMAPEEENSRLIRGEPL